MHCYSYAVIDARKKNFGHVFENYILGTIKLIFPKIPKPKEKISEKKSLKNGH